MRTENLLLVIVASSKTDGFLFTLDVERLGVKERQARNILTRLVREGLIEKIGRGLVFKLTNTGLNVLEQSKQKFCALPENGKNLPVSAKNYLFRQKITYLGKKLPLLDSGLSVGTSESSVDTPEITATEHEDDTGGKKLPIVESPAEPQKVESGMQEGKDGKKKGRKSNSQKVNDEGLELKEVRFKTRELLLYFAKLWEKKYNMPYKINWEANTSALKNLMLFLYTSFIKRYLAQSKYKALLETIEKKEQIYGRKKTAQRLKWLIEDRLPDIGEGIKAQYGMSVEELVEGFMKNLMEFYLQSYNSDFAKKAGYTFEVFVKLFNGIMQAYNKEVELSGMSNEEKERLIDEVLKDLTT